MEFTLFVILASSFITSLPLLLWCWNYSKKVAGFPVYNLPLQIFKWLITGKISKDTPLNNVVFEQLIEIGKQHFKEGLFVTHSFQPQLWIFSSEVIKFFANEKAAVDKSPEYKFFEEAIGNGIGLSNGEKWKTHRKLINPAFQMGVLKEKVPLFNNHAMALIRDMETLAEKSSVDILDVLKKHYFYALSESIMGLKQDKRNEEKLFKLAGYVDNLGAMIVQRIFCPWLRWRFMLNFIRSGRKYLQEVKECSDFINDKISDMKKLVTSTIHNKNEDGTYFSNHLRKSFTYILLNHHLNNPNTFTFQHLHDEVKLMMVAGYDTVSYTTMWCLFLLAEHPEIQEKLFHEIQSGTSSYITDEETCNLIYLNAVIMETLRLFPTIPVFARNLTQDVQFGKYKVFKGTSITFFPYLSNRNPKIFLHPEKFDPDRFLNAELKKSWSFIPFSEGNRNCIGKNYALIEMRIFLSYILRNFQITCLDRKEDVKLCWTLVISPVKRLRFKITPRKDVYS